MGAILTDFISLCGRELAIYWATWCTTFTRIGEATELVTGKRLAARKEASRIPKGGCAEGEKPRFRAENRAFLREESVVVTRCYIRCCEDDRCGKRICFRGFPRKWFRENRRNILQQNSLRRQAAKLVAHTPRSGCASNTQIAARKSLLCIDLSNHPRNGRIVPAFYPLVFSKKPRIARRGRKRDPTAARASAGRCTSWRRPGDPTRPCWCPARAATCSGRARWR